MNQPPGKAVLFIIGASTFLLVICKQTLAAFVIDSINLHMPFEYQ